MAARKRTIDRADIPVSLRSAFRGLSALAPPVAAALAERLFLRTRRHPLPERELTVLQGAERHDLATERGPAVGWVWGRPAPAAAPVPTVYLVHGWEGRGSQLGAFVEPLRRAGFRVVAFDAPGHGEAPGRSSSLPALAAALEAASRRWGPAVGLVAHSAGTVAATCALSRGLRVERAVFVAPGADLVGYTRWFAELLGLSDRVRRRLEGRIERRIGLSFPELEPLELAPAMTTPLLAYTDRDDPEAPLETAEALVRRWGRDSGRGDDQRAELRVTEGLGHRRILRNASVVTGSVEFLAGGVGTSATASRRDEQPASALGRASEPERTRRTWKTTP